MPRPNTHNLVAPTLVFLALLFVYARFGALSELTAFGLGADAAPALQRVIGTLLWLAGAWLVGRVLNTLIFGAHLLRRTAVAAPGILKNSITTLVFAAAIFGIIHFVFERPIGGLLATSGLLTLVIGFALRDMIADFFSGLAMNVEQPYSIGDWIELEPGLVGRVTELNWRATRLVTLSHRSVIVPNSNLASRQFINFSRPQRNYRESLEIVLNFDTETGRAQNILLAAVLATPGLAEGGKHNIKIKGLSERGVVYDVRFWIADYTERAALRDRVTASILKHLAQAGISIPHLQHELFMARSRRLRQEGRIDARRLLSRVGLLAPLTGEELTKLADVSHGREFDAGTEIVRQGETGESLYLLVEGALRASMSGRGTDTAQVGVVEPGEVFGEMSLLTGAPRAATVTAMTDVFALEIHRRDFEPILRARPEIADELGRVMAERVSSMQRAETAARESNQDEVTTRAQQITRRISAFFGLSEERLTDG